MTELLELYTGDSLHGRTIDQHMLRGAMSGNWHASASRAHSWVGMAVAGVDRDGIRRGVFRIGAVACWTKPGANGQRVPQVSFALQPAEDLEWLVGTDSGGWPQGRQLHWRTVEMPVLATV